MPREDFDNAVAAAKLVVIQGRRRSVDRCGRQAQAGCRFHQANLKVDVTELQEQLGISEEAGISIKRIAQQARNENGHKIFEIFRQGEEEESIASRARWNAQLKGLAELVKRCQNMMQEVKLLTERQEVLKGMVEDKIRLQSRATEVEEKKSKEALLLVAEKAYFDEISE